METLKKFIIDILAAILATAKNWRFLFLLAILTATASAKIMRVTAYCPCPVCCGKWGWGYQTASGYKIKRGDRLVAAPKVFRFGAILSVSGYNGGKPVKVLDRGGAIKGNRLDVYFDTHKEALQWGVRYVEVKEFVK